ncbi:carboxypeptidase-like regulatory domain-containing protein [Bremerella alba]|uniref:Carboxypeptidase regulatory-like domain-containing protein n=1 Tax=Bremerella alba TaxID=980252 RepID=A0A7V8V5D1_9BACT|nr:carboxypeptidase-like regulatory domain-containing protein [Bremerella alba]MBA2115213.1 hypothetical protein [Bremerella alba]
MNHFMSRISRSGILFSLFVSLTFVGCSETGPASGFVQGVVTLDGAPLPNAELAFYPEQGRASQGVTDESGHYSLMFTYDTPGCLPGNHEVMITTRRLESEEQGAMLLPERVPRKYRKRGELTAAVEPGENEINFDLSK